jgi:hypothetical protein
VRDFVVGERRVRGGLIGSVSTDPAWRGQGLATRLLVEAEAALLAEGCAFALLWATDPRFYLERGYYPVGCEHDFIVTSELACALPEPTGVRRMRPEDALAIHRLYTRHAVRIARTPAETEVLLACPGMDVLVAERDGAVVAYGCLGRGADLTEAIHEWAGADEDVLRVVRALVESRFPVDEPGRLFLLAPPDAEGLRRRLVALGAPVHAGILGLGKVLDHGALLALADGRFGPECRAELRETGGAPRLFLAGPAGEVLLDEDAMLALFFPTADVHDSAAVLLSRLGVDAPPLAETPFAWGLDSI